jgi:hypothetical protein
MARLITEAGFAGNVVIGSPQEGMKWIIIYAVIVLHTSATSGTRNAYLTVQRGGNSVDVGPILANTGNVTLTSANFSAIGDVTQSTQGNALTIYYQYPQVYAVDSIALFTTLISGDTVDVYLMVEEGSS